MDKDAWSHITRADGLPSDQVQALAFDRAGALYLATQCDGIVKAPRDATGQYRRFLHTTGPDRMPNTPTGVGLPTSLLNDVLVGRDGAIYAATTTGLAASRDQGRSWSFTRGKNWEAKVKALFDAPKPQPTCRAEDLFLQEDCVTCLAEDGQGKIWVGHRQKAVVRFDPARMSVLSTSIAQANAKGVDFVTAMVPMPNEPAAMVLGAYGQGISVATFSPGKPLPGATPSGRAKGSGARNGDKRSSAAAHPSAAQPPSEEELKAFLRQLTGSSARRRAALPRVLTLHDDWRTQGDWLGRCGRYWACLAAVRSPYNLVYPCENLVDYREQIGPKSRDDSIRYWVHWLYTDNRRSLEMTPAYFNTRIEAGFADGAKPRRQAEWDDHGETYPISMDGPHIFVKVEVPEGWHFLSAYFFNKDGHDGMNRLRDYVVEIRGDCRIGCRGRHTADDEEMRTIGWNRRRFRGWAGACGGCPKRASTNGLRRVGTTAAPSSARPTPC